MIAKSFTPKRPKWKGNVPLGHFQLFLWLNAQPITKNKHYSYEHDHMCLESKLKQRYVSST
jgi:hypothetical protein